MSYCDYFDEEWEQPEITEIEGMDEAVKLETTAFIDATLIQTMVSKYISDNAHRLIKEFIQEEVKKCINDTFRSKASFKEALENVMEKKFTEKYPDAVENKVNEMAKKIKAYEMNWGRGHSSDSIQNKALTMVNDYIDNELSKEVKKSTDYLEQYSKNYFANNLFRAMGMMDKLIPIAEHE